MAQTANALCVIYLPDFIHYLCYFYCPQILHIKCHFGLGNSRCPCFPYGTYCFRFFLYAWSFVSQFYSLNEHVILVKELCILYHGRYLYETCLFYICIYLFICTFSIYNIFKSKKCCFQLMFRVVQTVYEYILYNFYTKMFPCFSRFVVRVTWYFMMAHWSDCNYGIISHCDKIFHINTIFVISSCYHFDSVLY